MRAIILALLLSIVSIGIFAKTQVTVVGLFPGMAMIYVNGNQYTLHAGDITPEGVMLISADSKRAVLKVKGKEGTFLLGRQPSGNSKSVSADNSVTSTSIKEDKHGMFHVEGSINGQPARFLLDTGASKVVMNSNLAKKLNIEYLEKGRPLNVQTASGRTKGYEVQLEQLGIGEIQLENIAAIVIEGDSPVNPLLGMSALKHLEMNRKGQTLHLQHAK